MDGKSILIVDDHPASRVYLANFLKGKSFEGMEAPAGKEVPIAAGRATLDLVLFYSASGVFET